MAHATTSDEAMAQTDIAVAEARVYSTFKDRCSGLRWGVDFILADAIRTAHIGLNVTPISARSCDLVGFAKAGHAIAALITNSDKYLPELSLVNWRARKLALRSSDAGDVAHGCGGGGSRQVNFCE
jgi:hypothetical protein